MLCTKSPLIVTGQIYLNEELDEYLIVIKNNRGQVYYKGDGFGGQAEDASFMTRYLPVDPEDVEEEELVFLLSFCPDGTCAKIGYIMNDEDEEYELVTLEEEEVQ